MKVAVVAIRDADYLNIDPKASFELAGDDALIIRLPCKELENLLLLDATTVASAAKKAAEARATETATEPKFPSEAEVEVTIAQVSQMPFVRQTIEDQWIVQWFKVRGKLSDAGQLAEARREFETRWQNLAWRRRCCPGKAILRRVRQWLQAEPWKLSVSPKQLFDAFEPDAELRSLFDKVQEYVDRVLPANREAVQNRASQTGSP